MSKTITVKRKGCHEVRVTNTVDIGDGAQLVEIYDGRSEVMLSRGEARRVGLALLKASTRRADGSRYRNATRAAKRSWREASQEHEPWGGACCTPPVGAR